MPGLCVCEAKWLTSLKVQKTKGRHAGEKRRNTEVRLGMTRRTRDGHRSPTPAGSHGTGHARSWPLRRKSRLRLGLQPRALRPVPGYGLTLTVSLCELRNTRDNLGSRTLREPLRSPIPHWWPGERRRPGSSGAAGGTSASEPGRDRAVAGGSCSPAVVGGARGSCAVHRGLFHICNNR